MYNGRYQALVGLAFPAFTEGGMVPLFDNLMVSGRLPKKLFAFYLTTDVSKSSSEITFGYYDRSKFTGNIEWHPSLDNKTVFKVKLDDVLVNGKPKNLCGPNAERSICYATVDSGSSLVIFPKYVEQHMSELPSYRNHKECTSAKQFGSLTLVINGRHYILESDEFVYEPIFDRAERRLVRVLPEALERQTARLSQKSSSEGLPVTEQVGECRGAINYNNLNKEKNLFVLGDVFMRKFYTVWDREFNRIGFAKAKLP